VLGGELLLLADRIDADAHALGPNLLELGPQIPEVASLSGASAGHRARIEEKHDRPCAEHLAEPTRMAGFVREFEIRSAVAALHGFTLLIRTRRLMPKRQEQVCPRPGRPRSATDA
jgi:cytosine/adenosine deaminase-related metal-dependent hydrolase